MKRRSEVVLMMRILEEVRREPRGPTRISQATNLAFDKCLPYLQALEQKRLIRKDSQEGKDVYSITQEGIDLFLSWEGIWEKLKP